MPPLSDKELEELLTAAGKSLAQPPSSLDELLPLLDALAQFQEVTNRYTQEEQCVFDLSSVKPHEFVQYGLSCLEKFSALGDHCAKHIRDNLRLVVAGGDGTVGWVLGCIGELNSQLRLPLPPTGIIPLGTGNDLSRSFGWGGSFPFNWKSAIKRTLDKITHGPIARLDSWHILISKPAGEELEIPYSLKPTEEIPLDEVCFFPRSEHMRELSTVAEKMCEDFVTELENRLLSRFDAASQMQQLYTVAACAKILSQP